MDSWRVQVHIPFLMEYIGDIIFLEDVVDHLKNEEDILSHEWLGGSPVTWVFKQQGRYMYA